MKSLLLATVIAVGTIAGASAQSQMNQTPGNAQRDPAITASTHCMDMATKQPRMRQTTGGSMAAGNATAGDKSARSTGTTSQSSQSPGGPGGAMYSDLSAC